MTIKKLNEMFGKLNDNEPVKSKRLFNLLMKVADNDFIANDLYIEDKAGNILYFGDDYRFFTNYKNVEYITKVNRRIITRYKQDGIEVYFDKDQIIEVLVPIN